MYIPQIIQGIGLIKYTPNSGTIPMNFGTMFLTEDCIMSVTDHFDHDEDDVPFKAGYHPLMFKKIRSISTGSIYLCHNGHQPSFENLIKSNGITNQDTNRVILLIVGGQSNDGTDPATGRAPYAQMPLYLRQPNYNNVWFYNIDLSNIGFTLYQPQSDRQLGYLDQVVYILSKTYEKVYVVKRASTGTELAETVGSPDYPKAEMISRAKEAINLMNYMYPNGYDKLMQWGQGESDGDNETESLAYETNLTNWISEFNTAIGEDITWVIRRIGNLQVDFPYRANVAAAQDAVANSNPLIHVVNCDEISMQSRFPGGTDDAHFGASGAIAIGKLLAEKHLNILRKPKNESTPPILQSVEVDESGLIVTMTYSKILNNGVMLHPRQWSIGSKTIKTVTINDKTVTLTLSSPIRVGDNPTISYTKNVFYRENLQDLQSNEVDDLAGVIIINNSTVPAATYTLLYESNFSSGTDGFYGTSGGVVSGSTTINGVTNCLKCAGTDESPIYEKYFGSGSYFLNGVTYKIVFDMYVPPLFGYDQNNPFIRTAIISPYQGILSAEGLFYRGEESGDNYQFYNYEAEFTSNSNKGFFRFEASFGNFVSAGQYFGIKNIKIYRVS